MMTTGVSLIKHNPDEPDSPINQIRVVAGINITLGFNGDFQNQYTQDNNQGKYIVNNVTQGTHSTTTGNKFSNGGDRIYHWKWEENDDKQISLKVQGGEQYFVNYKIDKSMPDKYNLAYNLTLGIGAKALKNSEGTFVEFFQESQEDALINIDDCLVQTNDMNNLIK